MKKYSANLTITIKETTLKKVIRILLHHQIFFLCLPLCLLSIGAYIIFYFNHLGLAYNDARSHLDIGRRVVEGLKPGLAQLGSVWLPLPHLLIALTAWNNFMWHSGLSGAIISMVSFVYTGVLIYKFLQLLGVKIIGRLVGVFIFAANLNILYMQSTAMTELPLLVTMTAGVYELTLWHKNGKLLPLLKSAFWIMLSTLIRYDGWFLCIFAGAAVIIEIGKKWLLKKQSFSQTYTQTEGTLLIFATLAGLGIIFWFGWNLLIFKDPLYFAFGPYSAHTQQLQLEKAGNLPTEKNLWESFYIYTLALIYNSNFFILILGTLGAVWLWLDKKITTSVRLSTMLLTVPLIFNILALYLGHSVLFIQGIDGNTWFNVRYGLMMIPSVAIFAGFFVDRMPSMRLMLIGTLLLIVFFSITSVDAVTIDDATVGSSQKNVTQISAWLSHNVTGKKGYILISVASHDAIIFTSGLPMSRYIHEGTGKYWDEAIKNPDHWARWIVMRTYDNNDLTWRLIHNNPELSHYHLVDKYPFADVYELDNKYVPFLITQPIFANQK